jgi:hypothetical protein
MIRLQDLGPRDHFMIVDLIDGERRESYYRRRGASSARHVPTILYGFRQWDRDGRLRVDRVGDGTRQLTDRLVVVSRGWNFGNGEVTEAGYMVPASTLTCLLREAALPIVRLRQAAPDRHHWNPFE